LAFGRAIEHFGFPLSPSFHQRSLVILIYPPLLTGQTGEASGFSNQKAMLLRKSGSTGYKNIYTFSVCKG